MTSRTASTSRHGGLLICCAFAVAPLLGLAVASLNSPNTLVSGFGVPAHPHLSTFAHAWNEGGFSSAMKASLIVTGSVVIVTSLLAILAGYALGTMRFRGATVVFYVMLVGLMFPSEVILVPLYYDLLERGIVGSYTSIILPEIGLSLSFGVYWMRAFFLSAPRPLMEAARIDGANSFTILTRVLLPLAVPAITTMVVLLFMFTWNDFLLPLIMVGSSTGHQTAPLGLANFQSRYGTDVPDLAAGALLVAVPVMVVYVLLQRRVIRGVVQGAVKG